MRSGRPNARENLSRRAFLGGAVTLPAALAKAQARPLVIDAHCHAGHGVQMLAPWTTRGDLEVTLRNMAEAGIDRTIIFPIQNPGYERANQEIAEICAQYPGKFIGFARHDVAIEGDRIPKMLKHEIANLGLKGLKVIGKPPTRATMDVAAEFKVPLLYHQSRLEDFRTLAEQYPAVPLIIAHMGSYNFVWPNHLEAISLARQYPSIYLDTSCAAYADLFEIAVKETGADKLIFGSDGPEFDSRLTLYRMKVLKLPPAEEAKVLGGNIRRLLPEGTV